MQDAMDGERVRALPRLCRNWWAARDSNPEPTVEGPVQAKK
jgi:hypothetical protein